MALQKCSQCGQIFTNQINKDKKLCPTCYQQQRDEFRKVRDYLWDNPGVSVVEISRNTDVTEKTIREFIREGRFDKR
ncbi:hypothetical protein [Halanaerobaculum tunisiense]